MLTFDKRTVVFWPMYSPSVIIYAIVTLCLHMNCLFPKFKRRNTFVKLTCVSDRVEICLAAIPINKHFFFIFLKFLWNVLMIYEFRNWFIFAFHSKNLILIWCKIFQNSRHVRFNIFVDKPVSVWVRTFRSNISQINSFEVACSRTNVNL